MGRWHARCAARAGATITAIIDTNAAAAEALRRRHRGAAVFGDLASALNSAAIDIVHICTGIDNHALLATQCLQADKHLLVEKPLAATLAQTQQILALAEEKGLYINPVHQFPFQRGFRKLLGHRADLGELVSLHYTTYSAGGTGKTDSQRKAILLEILPHPVSLFRPLLGDSLADEDSRTLTFTSDDLVVTGQSRNIRWTITISLRARPTRNELLVAGASATALVDFFHGYCVVETGDPSPLNKMLRPLLFGSTLLTTASANLLARAVRREPAYPGLGELIARFYRSLQNKSSPPISAEEMLETAAFIDKISNAAP